MFDNLLRRGERACAPNPAEVFRTFLRTIEAAARGARAAPSCKAAPAASGRAAQEPRRRVRRAPGGRSGSSLPAP